VPYMAEFGM
nr:Chain B, pCPA12 [synthetic construct]